MAQRLKTAILGNANSGRKKQLQPDCPCLYTHNEKQALKALRSFGPLDVLGIHGGDGTLDIAIKLIRNHQIFDQEPAIALLKGGTTNMTWRDVGIKTLPTAKPQTQTRNVIKIQAKDMETQYGFFFGLGAVPRAIKRFNQKGDSGIIAESRAIGALFWRLFTGKAEGHDILNPMDVNDNQTILFTAATLHRLLLGMNPAPPGAGMGCVTLNNSYRGLWHALPRMLINPQFLPARHTGITRTTHDKIALAFNGDWTLDGELFTATQDNPLHLSLDTPVRFVCHG